MVKRGMKPKQAAELRVKSGIEVNKLQKVRVKRNMSQNDLATASGIPASTLRNYEQGKRPIDNAKLDVILDVCLALSCRMEDILESKETIAKLNIVK